MDRFQPRLLKSLYSAYMCTLGMLDMASWRGSRMILIVKLALKAGSSKQGKAARANVASNCVDARPLEKTQQILAD